MKKYYGRDENYDFFLEKTLDDNFKAWGDNILKRIARNDEWFHKIQLYRKQIKGPQLKPRKQLQTQRALLTRTEYVWLNKKNRIVSWLST